MMKSATFHKVICVSGNAHRAYQKAKEFLKSLKEYLIIGNSHDCKNEWIKIFLKLQKFKIDIPTELGYWEFLKQNRYEQWKIAKRSLASVLE